jgi:hypothetical protein
MKFWNLRRREGQRTLTREEELEYILQLLEDDGAHVRVRSGLSESLKIYSG